MSDTLLTSMGINAVFHVHKEESRTPFRWLLMGFCHEERCDVETLAFNLFRVNNKTICYGIAIHRDGCGMSHPVFYQSYVAKKDVECCLNGCSIFSLLNLFQEGI